MKYNSPDNQWIGWAILFTVLQGVLLLTAVVFTFQRKYDAALVSLVFVGVRELMEIHTELTATRRLSEISKRAAWSVRR